MNKFETQFWIYCTYPGYVRNVARKNAHCLYELAEILLYSTSTISGDYQRLGICSPNNTYFIIASYSTHFSFADKLIFSYLINMKTSVIILFSQLSLKNNNSL